MYTNTEMDNAILVKLVFILRILLFEKHCFLLHLLNFFPTCEKDAERVTSQSERLFPSEIVCKPSALELLLPLWQLETANVTHDAIASTKQDTKLTIVAMLANVYVISNIKCTLCATVILLVRLYKKRCPRGNISNLWAE